MFIILPNNIPVARRKKQMLETPTPSPAQKNYSGLSVGLEAERAGERLPLLLPSGLALNPRGDASVGWAAVNTMLLTVIRFAKVNNLVRNLHHSLKYEDVINNGLSRGKFIFKIIILS